MNQDLPKVLFPGTWCDVPSRLPWVESFNEQMRRTPVPRLTGKEIIIASDWSGLHGVSPYEVIGITILDLDASLRWEAERQYVRREILKDSRRMSFKQLSEPVRKRATIPFLVSANKIVGLCLCAAFHKSIRTIGLPPEIHRHLAESGILRSNWSPQSFDRMSQTAHIISVLLAGLCSEGQNITWISDEDEMFESPSKAEDTRRIVSVLSSMYVRWKPGRLAIGTTKLDEGDRFEEDLVAVSDLAAGAFSDAMTRLHAETGGRVAWSVAPTLSGKLSKKTDLLLSWLEDESTSLKRALFVFDSRPDGKFCVARIWSHPLDVQP